MLTTLKPLIAAIVLLSAAEAQKLPVSQESGANLPARTIGANDLLSVSVYGAPEFSRSVRVDTSGLIRLPMLKQKVKASGAMPAEIETSLARAFAEEDLLIDPVVTVNIAEYSKRPISVAGAVRRPLTFDALDQITLLDALARAEGLNAEAGREILITRPLSAAGQPPRIERVSVRDLIEEAKPGANLLLQGGEEVRVPETGRVFVVGNVRKPGAFRLTDGDAVSVLQAIALSEGLAPFSSKDAYIYRPAADGSRTEIVVPLRKVLNRKSADVFLQASDILYVPVPAPKGAPPEHYFHFDSWRVNVGPGQWAPAQIYIEEEGDSDAAGHTPRFKAQTRIWNVAAAPLSKTDELTRILIENEADVKDQVAANDASPLESQRSWEKQAEENILARLERGGFLAPPGPVDDVLNTVVNNLIFSASLGVEARCRVLLTSPLETFSIGHTIVISRGLIRRAAR